MTESVDRTIFVQSVKRRVRYESVPGDDMAYDVTETLADKAQEGDEIAKDLVALDSIRAELGLVDLHLGTQLVNRLWRLVGFDRAALSPQPTKRRQYRIGHPKHH